MPLDMQQMLIMYNKKIIPIKFDKITFNSLEIIEIIISKNPKLLEYRPLEEWLKILICYPSRIGYKSNPLSKVKFFNQKKIQLVKDDSYGLVGFEDSYRIYSKEILSQEELNSISL